MLSFDSEAKEFLCSKFKFEGFDLPLRHDLNPGFPCTVTHLKSAKLLIPHKVGRHTTDCGACANAEEAKKTFFLASTGRVDRVIRRLLVDLCMHVILLLFLLFAA